MRLETKFVHAGVNTDAKTGSIAAPIYQTATFRHPGLGKTTGYDYSRSINPTREVLEKTIAQLEEGKRGLAFASGMAAITAVLLLFKKGDHLVVSEDLYGGTFRLMTKVFTNFGLESTFIDTSDLIAVESAIKSNTRAVFLESPTNPLLKVADIPAISKIAASKNILVVVDNTFMTPYLQRPLSLGADIVVHSATKYLSGHNDVVAGLLAARTKEIGDRLYNIQNATGGILGPQDSWLLLRGMKTLAVRMEKQQQTAEGLAHWLQTLPEIDRVYYPGLPHHPGNSLIRSQAGGYGGMLSFSVCNPGLVGRILDNLELLLYAESLGGVESLITFPALQTHGDLPESVRKRLGITDNLLRLSVGLENIEDIKDDLLSAMRR